MVTGLAGLQVGLGSAPAFAASGVVSGVVFHDFNANGVRDTNSTIPNAGGGTIGVAVDGGVEGTAITAFDSAGAVVGSASSAADGTYTLTVSNAATSDVRLEFTQLPIVH